MVFEDGGFVVLLESFRPVSMGALFLRNLGGFDAKERGEGEAHRGELAVDENVE